MSEGEVYCIMNLDKYAEFVRKKAAASFSENYNKDEINGLVTVAQAILMVKENSIGLDENERHLIDDKAYETLFEAMKTRIYNSGLSKLAAQGHLECAWDEKRNEMVFWSTSQP
jgi:hypothetical protein